MTFPEPDPFGTAKVDISHIDKYAPTQIIGREAELEVLDHAWNQAVRGDPGRPRILAFVALGGEGKTSLVAKWAAQLAHKNWPGCEAAFACSFCRQGAREQAAACSPVPGCEASPAAPTAPRAPRAIWKRPGTPPRTDLSEACRLMEKLGYWRRKEELEDAEAGILQKPAERSR
jgi:hypothetical protein